MKQKSIFYQLKYYMTSSLFVLLITGCSWIGISGTGDPKGEIVIHWYLPQDSDIHEIQLFRSEYQYGLYDKVDVFLTVEPDSSEAMKHFTITDKDLVADTTYFYYIESISSKGERETLSPILKFRAAPKR